MKSPTYYCILFAGQETMKRFVIPIIVAFISYHILPTIGQPMYPTRYQRRFYRAPARSYEMQGALTPNSESTRQPVFQRHVSFNPDPDADIYTEQGVPFPGSSSSQTRSLGSRYVDRRPEPYQRGTSRQAPRQYDSQRKAYTRYGGSPFRDLQSVTYEKRPQQPRRYTAYSTRASVDRYRTAPTQSLDRQQILPRYTDLGIRETPGVRSAYHYVNRDPDHVPSRPVRTESSHSLGRQQFKSQSSPEIHKYVTSRPGDFSRLSLPIDAWKTVSTAQTGKSSKRSHSAQPNLSIVSLPRASEYIASSPSIKRTRVPSSTVKVERSAQSEPGIQTKAPTKSKSVTQRKISAAKVEVQKKRATDTAQTERSIVAPGLESISIESILRDYNLTATGSYFLTRETRRRNALALQNVVRRRPRRREGRKTRRF